VSVFCSLLLLGIVLILEVDPLFVFLLFISGLVVFLNMIRLKEKKEKITFLNEQGVYHHYGLAIYIKKIF
jgi:hypothetical protein